MAAVLARGAAWRGGPPALAAARRLSGSAGAQWADKGMRDAQDPSKTWQAYDAPPEPRDVPKQTGTEKEIKWGENIPASTEQAKEELKYAGKGLAQSVQQAAGVLYSIAHDAVAAAERTVGMESDRPEMSAGTMGAAGKMEHAPPGVKGGGIAATPENAAKKYAEISDTEKPHYPEGEQSVNDRFPEMKVAAGEQSNTPERQRVENENIRQELHKPS